MSGSCRVCIETRVQVSDPFPYIWFESLLFKLLRSRGLSRITDSCRHLLQQGCLEFRTVRAATELMGSRLSSARVPYFGILIIRILLLRVLYRGPLFSETPTWRFRVSGEGVCILRPLKRSGWDFSSSVCSRFPSHAAEMPAQELFLSLRSPLGCSVD